MFIRYRAGLAVTSLFLLIAASPYKPVHSQDAPPARSVLDLYSKRALRRARTILQLQLLEIRAHRLESIANAVRRTLRSSAAGPPDTDKERLPIDLP